MKTANKTQKENMFVSDLEKESIRLLETVSAADEELKELYPKMLEEDCSVEVSEKSDSFRRASGNITKALTQMYAMNDELTARNKDISRHNKRAKWNMLNSANAVIDANEDRANHFAKGINMYKIMLVTILGSFFGVVIELAWCMLENGYIESRSGLVYGPFNLLYGVGAATLTVCLYKYRNRGAWLSFLGGMLVGSVVEYACSFFQELFIGTRSWDYSNFPFNINGRICLLYSVFWGFLGVIWIKRIYPEMAKYILRLPQKLGKAVTWVLVVFMVFNAGVTMIATLRWTERVKGDKASNAFERFIDERFPNKRMENVFANMEFLEE